MGDVSEVLITSDSSANLWTSCVWDYNSGTSLHCYKAGGVVTSHTLDFIGNDYFIAAEHLKPLIHVWPINSQETLKNIKVVCSGRVSAMAISPDGCYCAAGIGEQLHIWQVRTGRLLAIASKHFQVIINVAFTSDGSHIVSAGEDGLVLVWVLSHLITQKSLNVISCQTIAGQVDPLHTISDHSLPVRAIKIAGTGLNSRLLTVSADCTLKVYQLVSGNLLLSVVFDKGLTSVTTNKSDTAVYIGSSDGNIYEYSFLNPPRNKEYHFGLNGEKSTVFRGHTKSISCLSLSADGQTLASGSMDGQVILWHIPTKQKLRSIPHNGNVTNIAFKMATKNMFANDFKPSTIFRSFQRNISVETEEQVIDVIHTENIKLPFIENCNVNVSPSFDVCSSIHYADEINKLRAINHKLYQFALENIINKSQNSNVDSKIDESILLKRKRKNRT